MLLLGIDIGTSSIKVSVVDAASQQCLGSAQYPETESPVRALHPGWAEQSPDMWWENLQLAMRKLHAQQLYDPQDIAAAGIAYQMHGLVLTDREGNSLRDSIIWCDSRAVDTGERAGRAIGTERCLLYLLNAPGNFTAAKLGWVKEHEPAVFARAVYCLLPGDYLSFRMTGTVSTTIPALSEGIFWDFREDRLSDDILGYFGFDPGLFPPVRDVFGEHGRVSPEAARALSLPAGIPVTYKAGDQPNNALSLNVFNPGEVAATAGTSGVVYAVTDRLAADPESRVNSFAHVNYAPGDKRIGVLLCINGTGSCYRWMKDLAGNGDGYAQLNAAAAKVPAGSAGLQVFPFGNGAERMLGNRTVHAQIRGIDFNTHGPAHLFRAAQEGIAFAFRYGLGVLRESGVQPRRIRAGKSNMFQSALFARCFTDTLGIPLELYDTDGSRGAALGAGLGAGLFSSPAGAFRNFRPVESLEPATGSPYADLYETWLRQLEKE